MAGMNEETVRQVQQSFKALVPRADEVGVLFYARLFDTYPEVRRMFPDDIKPQAKKLVQMLAVVVGSLHRFDTILPAVADLARRHNGYGVVEEHYEAVGLSLIWTLRCGLGAGFTPAVEQAWMEAYAALSSVMIAAAKGPASAGRSN
jgi:nitric oxide dioxygenase